tara:strand:- start:1331 stop:1438 length:108 start_codon:yes stop_codon:yes gene_type:complete
MTMDMTSFTSFYWGGLSLLKEKEWMSNAINIKKNI